MSSRKSWGSIRRGLAWNAVNLVANKGVGILTRLMLARLLVPDYFGLVAMVIVFLSLLGVFIDFGLQNALIQRPRDENSLTRYHSAFWFLLAGGAGWTLFFVLACVPAMVWFYHEPRLLEIAFAMAPSLMFQSVAIVPEVRLTRRLRFKSIAIAEVTSTLVAAGLAIGLALAGAGIHALVAQQVAYAGLRSLLIWYFARWRPRLRFEWASLNDVTSFSSYVLGARVLYFIRTNLDTLVIGALLGATSLGVHTIAYAITENVRAQFARIISRVMLPVYSRMQHDTEMIRPHYLNITRAMTLVFFPLSLSLILFAKPIIETLFSVEWQAAIVPTQLLAAGGMVYALSGPATEVFQGIGRVKALFLISTFNVAVIGFPLMWILTSLYGLVGAAAAMLLSFISMRILSFVVLRRYLFISLSDVLRATGPALVAASLLTALNLLTPNRNLFLGLATILSGFSLTASICYRDALRTWLKARGVKA